MTRLLLTAIVRLQKLPAAQQDEIATRILDDLRAEELWDEKFAGTTDAEWENLLQEIDLAVDEEESTSMDDFLRA
jgi:hypothetical protein